MLAVQCETYPEDGGSAFVTDYTMTLRRNFDGVFHDTVPHFLHRVTVKRAPMPKNLIGTDA